VSLWKYFSRSSGYQILTLLFCCVSFAVPLWLKFGSSISAIFRSPSTAVIGGIWGDQAFYLWMLERAQKADSYAGYVFNCSWNSSGCFHLEAFPQEWPSLYFLGKLGLSFGFSSVATMNAWYVSAMLMNAVVAAALILRLTKNLILAVAFGPVVATQVSILGRFNGHFSLVAIWPALLFVFVFASIIEWVEEEGYLISKNKGLTAETPWYFRKVWPFVLFIPVAFIFVQTSFYYFIFAAFSAFVLGFFKTIIHFKRIKGVALIRATMLSMPGLLALLASLWIVSYTFLPDPRYADLGTHKRTLGDVAIYSARWVDFVAPQGQGPFISLVFETLGIKFRPEMFSGRGELLSFLGSPTLAIFFCSLLLSFLSRRWKLPPKIESDSQKIAAWQPSILLPSALVTLYFTTIDGGRLLNLLFSGLRCFNRMAPIAVVFLAAFSISLFSNMRASKIISIVAAVLILSIQVYEFFPSRQHHLVVDSTLILNSAAKLARHCPEAHIEPVPRIDNFVHGPYQLYFVAERSGCQLVGVQGAGFESRLSNAENLKRKIRLTARWDKDNYNELIAIDGVPNEPKVNFK